MMDFFFDVKGGFNIPFIIASKEKMREISSLMILDDAIADHIIVTVVSDQNINKRIDISEVLLDKSKATQLRDFLNDFLKQQ